MHNDDEMEITLTMTLDPDLHLRFFDAATYVTWKRGLELLLTLLFAPGGPAAQPIHAGRSAKHCH